jgi:hypothetical protein
MMKKHLISLILISIVGLTYSQNYPDLDAYCKFISVEKDLATGETKYKTPFEHSISFRKLINNGVEAVFMRVSAVSKFDKKGDSVEIVFEKGYTISKKVASNYYENMDGTFTHYAEFRLNKDDISKLKNYMIITCKVYMYSQAVENNLQFQAYMHCLSKLH